jgi:hypothetical protein
MRPVAIAAVLLLFAVAASAQQRPQGEPETDSVVRDADFGVSARHFGLERRVEMLQWRQQGADYAKAWSDKAIDSSAFPEGHANPGFPIRSRRWIANVTIDGKPVATDALERLGEWQAFRPTFSALPGNLSATFQPEGDGLSSAENPLDPQVGDLRIHWRELTLPALSAQVELADGRWVASRGTAEAAAIDGAAAAPTVQPPSQLRAYWPWLLGGGVLLGLLLVLARRRRR